MLSPTKGMNSHHAPHSIESIQQRIQQHAERLSRWESQFQQWQDTWNEREVRLDRELALLEAATTTTSPTATRQLMVVRAEDLE